MSRATFILAGGGTGGHVIPLLAVAEELRKRGHEVLFVGTRAGIEARLVPAKGLPIEYIEIGGLAGVGWKRALKSLSQLPASTLSVRRRLRDLKAAAVFSLGGYAAGPVVLAARMSGVPVVAMEPNAVPGITNQRLGRGAARMLIAFPETASYFPSGKTEVTGLPVRAEFFSISPKPRGDTLNILITGGSRGSRTLNQASSSSWRLFRESGALVRIVHQSGSEGFEALRAEFQTAGLQGEVIQFIEDMPAAFREADLIVCRSGAGAVAELAAAGKPAILVPFPFAAGQHQLRNAEALERAGAARLILDRDMIPATLFRVVNELASEPGRLERMGQAARSLARPGAARRAAEILEEISGKKR